MIKIEFPINQNSTVFVYDGTALILKMERKFIFGSKIRGQIYQADKQLAALSSSLFGLKITENNVGLPLKVTSNVLFASEYRIGDNTIKIPDNPLYFLYKPFFSKIYYNDQLIAKVRLVKILDIQGTRLETSFSDEDKTKQLHCLICYLMNSMHLNI